MKLKQTSLAALMILFSTLSFAALECTDFKCDVNWKTSAGEIDLATVCFNYERKPEYQECRNLAIEVFTRRCHRGKENDNQIWIDIYCGALGKYKP
jgi:hypothetical protein